MSERRSEGCQYERCLAAKASSQGPHARLQGLLARYLGGFGRRAAPHDDWADGTLLKIPRSREKRLDTQRELELCGRVREDVPPRADDGQDARREARVLWRERHAGRGGARREE